MTNPTPNADAAPVVETTFRENDPHRPLTWTLPYRLRVIAQDPGLPSDISHWCDEAADRLDHLEARERAGRELAEKLREIWDSVYDHCPPGFLDDILTHLDGGSTND